MNVKHPNLDRKSPASGLLHIVEGAGSAVANFLADPFVSACAHAEPLTERKYATLFLAAIHSGEMSVRDWLRLLGGAESKSMSEPVKLRPEQLGVFRKVLSLAIEKPSPKRNQQFLGAQMRLESALAGRLAAVPAIHLFPKDRNPAALRQPMHLQGYELTTSYQVVGLDAQASLDYALALILSKYLKDLRQCQLDTCQRFFLVSDEGREKQREYCCKEHRQESLDKQGTDRVQASRAGVTADEWRRIKAIDPEMTPKKWNPMKASRSSDTTSRWLAQQRNRR